MSGAPNPVVLGNNLTYTLTVTNNGPDGATGVLLSDTLPPGVTFVSATPGQGSCTQASGTVTCSLGSLANGGSTTITVVVTPASIGTITSTATVSGNEFDPNFTNNTASLPILVIAPTATPTYTLTATPTHTPTGTLPPTFTPTNTPTLTPTATVTQTPSSTPTPVVDLQVAMTGAPAPVVLGSNLTYTLVVTNNGPSGATGVLLSDTLPPGVTFVSATPGQGSCTQSSGTMTCGVGTLANGGSTTIIVVVTPTSIGTITNTATVTGNEFDPNLSNNTASLPILVIAPTATPTNTRTATPTNTATGTLPPTFTPTNTPTLTPIATATRTPTWTPTSTSTSTPTKTPLPVADLQVSITDSPDPVILGNNVTYTIVVTNNGPNTATGVILTDNLPPDATLLFVAPGQGFCSLSSGAVTCNLGSLPTGHSTTITVVVTPMTTGTITTTAIVTGNEPDTNLTNNAASASTLVIAPTGVPTPTFTFTPSPTPTRTATPTASPSALTSATPTPIVARTLTPTRTPVNGAAPTATAAASPGSARPGGMGVRFVSIGRVNPGSDMYYSVAVVLFGKRFVPDVGAAVTLPAEVEFLDANPAPATAPTVGSSGVVTWALGDLTGPTNQPLQVHVQVRADLPLGLQFTGFLRVDNGLGEVATASRLSRVGKYDKPNENKGDNGIFSVVISAPRQVRAGGNVRYSVSVRSKAPIANLTVRSLVPAELQVDSAVPAANVDSSGIVEWSMANTKAPKFRLYAHVNPGVASGTVVETVIEVSDGQSAPVLVIGTTKIR